MATQCYDCFFLFDSNKYNRDPGGVAASVQNAIEELGGEILASRLWEERKLAYPIDGHNKGTYWITYFNLETDKLVELNRNCQLNGNIMRFLITKVDPRLVETLVAHALGTAEPERRVEIEPVSVGEFDD
ncbi:MAG: 30S ribosomal protein S6 [Planctomycetales bacterium]|nr:30S ribosomal protein S6 [Planctomycetales bacterium]